MVGILFDKSAYHPAPNPAEVEVIFHVPLEMFLQVQQLPLAFVGKTFRCNDKFILGSRLNFMYVLQDENRRAEEREWMGEKYVLQYFDYQTADENYVIFGLTAGMLIRVASVVYQRPPAFPELCPKFWHS